MVAFGPNVTAAYDELRGLGYDHAGASGIVGNLLQESGHTVDGAWDIRPGVSGDNGNSFGAVQWNGPRKRAYLSWAQAHSLDPEDVRAQMRFLDYELKGPEASASGVLGAGDPAAIAVGLSDRFWRPGAPHNERRARYARAVSDGFGGYEVAQADTGAMNDASPASSDPSREELLAEARRRGLIPATAEPAPVAEPSREEMLAEARRRGLIGTPENPPPAGMTAQQASEAAIAAEGQAAMDAELADSPVGRAGVSISSGLPFVGEWVDEGLGMIDPRAQERWRAAQDYQARNNPLMDLGLRTVGTVAGTVPALLAAAPAALAAAPSSLVGQAAAGVGLGAAGGAAEGAVSGAGAANGGDRMEGAREGALWGGIVGGVTGGVAPAAGGVARRATRYLRGGPDATAARRMGGSPESVEVVGRMIEADGPQQAAARITSAGPDAMLADAGPATAGLLDTAIQKAGPGARIAREAVEGRATRAGAEIQDALDDAFGRVTNAPPADRGAATGAYAAAYRSPIDYSSDVGMQIEGLLPRVPGSVINRANRLMQLEGAQSGQILAEIAEDGSVTYRTLPDVRQLDYITRALNDQARSGEAAGALGGMTAESRLLTNLSRDIRSALKEAVPAYKVALNRAATEIGKKEARDLGEVAMRSTTKRSDLEEAWADMPDAARAKFKEGVRSYFDETLANTRRAITDGNMDAREAMQALRELSSRAARDKLEMVLGKGSAARFMTRVDRVSRALELRASVATNSRTFGRQSMDEAIKAVSEPGFMAEVFSLQPVGAARKITQSLARVSPADRQQVQERIAGEIATLMTQSRGPDAVAQVNEIARLLTRAPETEALAQELGRIATTSAGAAGYQAGQQTLGR